jgi:endo-1,4-beta-xylanase
MATGLTRQEDEWRRFLDAVTAMGLRLLVTEFDVNDKGLPADIATRDRAVAELGRSYLELMLSYPQLDTLMCWGLSDRYSWLQSTSPRADGLPKRPCPYDESMKAKPLRDAIANAIRNAPVRI